MPGVPGLAGGKPPGAADLVGARGRHGLLCAALRATALVADLRRSSHGRTAQDRQLDPGWVFNGKTCGKR